MKTLAVANQKSVGKSTLAIHLAYAGAAAGLRVLMVDMDKQGSLTMCFPPINGDASGLLASSLYDEDQPAAALEYIGEKVAIIRATPILAALDSAPDIFIKRPRLNLRRFANDFDLCIIDTPGHIGMSLNASLAAADAVVCPVSIGKFEMKALSDLWAFIRAVKTKGYNPELRLIGILPNRVNTRSPLEIQGLQALREQYGPAILAHTLPERAAVKQSIELNRPVWVSTKGAGHLAAAKEWKAACKTILVKLGSIPQ